MRLLVRGQHTSSRVWPCASRQRSAGTSDARGSCACGFAPPFCGSWGPSQAPQRDAVGPLAKRASESIRAALLSVAWEATKVDVASAGRLVRPEKAAPAIAARDLARLAQHCARRVLKADLLTRGAIRASDGGVARAEWHSRRAAYERCEQESDSGSGHPAIVALCHRWHKRHRTRWGTVHA